MKAFLAFPFSSIISGDNNMVDERYQTFLSETRNHIMSEGFEVFLAHYREKWGKALMTAQECTPLDLIEMKDSDIVIAFPGSPISGGVHIELGWASAFGKKVVLFLKRGENYSPLINGMLTVTDTKIIYYDNIFVDNVQEKIYKEIALFKEQDTISIEKGEMFCKRA